jgi:hypothetical protein
MHAVSAVSGAATSTRCARANDGRRGSFGLVARDARAVRAVAMPRSARSGAAVTRRCERGVVAFAAPEDADESASEDVGSESDLSSSFADELAKRRADASTASSNPFDRLTGGGNKPAGAPPKFAQGRNGTSGGAKGGDDDQLARSRALQGEGLEGLPGRASELLKLGFTSFIGFSPFITAISILFCLTYLLFGSDFIHNGDGYGSPAFVPAEQLLGEPTVDPMVSFAPPPSTAP